jgi:ABC-type arginine transport system ATPase subunit
MTQSAIEVHNLSRTFGTRRALHGVSLTIAGGDMVALLGASGSGKSLPCGFHRIRHYGLLANSSRRDNLALARELLHVASPPPNESADEQSAAPAPTFVCAHCGHAMVVLEVLLPDCSIRAPPA